MKAKKFSFHAGLLCLAALFVTLLLLLSSCGEKTADEKDFTYTVENGQATVASYTPSGEISPKLIIPSTLGGYPVVHIGKGAFYELKNIKEIVLPDSVTDIGTSAFWGCTELTSITIPDSVTSIGDCAFWGCTGLMSVTIPDSVTSIGSEAFYGCAGLTSVTIPDSVTSIGSEAFYGCAIKVATIPASAISSIPNRALETVVITSGSSIPSWAFRDCTGLTSVTIPDSVTDISDSAFVGCTNLQLNAYDNALYLGNAENP